jgi:hypothetical protein
VGEVPVQLIELRSEDDRALRGAVARQFPK